MLLPKKVVAVIYKSSNCALRSIPLLAYQYSVSVTDWRFCGQGSEATQWKIEVVARLEESKKR